MKRRATVFVATLLAISAFQYTDKATAQSRDGWVVLFDGKNLDQWDAAATADASYAIEDGAVVAHKKDPKKTVFLVSKQKYKNFQLEAEFWVSDDANSGFFIRCEDPKKPGAKTCYEFNIFDKRPDPSYGTGAIVYHAEVSPMPKAGGKWSKMEITAKGRDLSVSFDGKNTAHARSGLHIEGIIALQFGVGTVKFRKVAIQPL